MKTALILFVFVCFNSLIAQEVAKKNKDLPDFTKLLPAEKFFNKQELPVGYTYGYATNMEFEGLKAAILKVLGQGWSFKDSSKEELTQLKKQMKGGGMVLLAASELKHAEFAHFEIGVTLVEGGKELGKKYVLSLVTIDKKKAQAYKNKKAEQETDQAPAVPESKPKSKENPKPESKGRSK